MPFYLRGIDWMLELVEESKVAHDISFSHRFDMLPLNIGVEILFPLQQRKEMTPIDVPERDS